MRWRLTLEEFGPELRYIKGERNVVADVLSRLETMNDQEYEAHQAECFSADMYANGKEDGPSDYPLTYEKIRNGQQADETLQTRWINSPNYTKTTFAHGDHSYELITRFGKIVLPEDLQRPAVEWYHDILIHPGESRTELTIGQHFYWKAMCT